MNDRDSEISRVFDSQAERFERAPVQSDPAALARLVAFSAFPPGARVLDAGCGPGLVAEAFLSAGHSVTGVDLSPEMVRRASGRCARFGERARFLEGSLFDLELADRFDAAVSRFVVHHAADPLRFIAAQVERLREGGVLAVCDHVTDPDAAAARWHNQVELSRDRTHTRNLSSGELADLCGRAGLVDLALQEEQFELDFDEWFDRGSPLRSKDEVRTALLAGRARGFDPEPRGKGVAIRCIRTLVRGRKPLFRIG